MTPNIAEHIQIYENLECKNDTKGLFSCNQRHL